MADSDQNPAVADIVRLVLKELNDQKISTVVTPSVSAEPAPSGPSSPMPKSQPSPSDEGVCLFANLDDAVAAARIAQRRFIDISLDRRARIVENIRHHALANAERLGQLGWAKCLTK